MTIFDVLRYNITDIFNNEELLFLPTSILETWIQRCANTTNPPTSINKFLLQAEPGNICFGIVTRKAWLLSNSGRSNNAASIELIKIQFAKILKEEIVKYEHPRDYKISNY